MRRFVVFAAAVLSACASAPAPQPAPPPGPPPIPAQDPITVEAARAKLEAISPHAVQLWVVVHIRAHKHVNPDGSVDEARLIHGALRDCDSVVQGGADAIVLINSRAELPVYERVITAIRERYPDFPIVVSALSYGPDNLTEGLRLAKAYSAQGVWTEVVPGEPFEYEDDDGTYKKAETTGRDFALLEHRKVKADAMHVSGVHMKYTRPLNGLDFVASMGAALGSVDGINVTGPKTGVRADVERIEKAREAAKGYPVGLASGVSLENVGPVLPFIDYAIVGTSLKEDDDKLRTSLERVWRLRRLMHSVKR